MGSDNKGCSSNGSLLEGFTMDLDILSVWANDLDILDLFKGIYGRGKGRGQRPPC